MQTNSCLFFLFLFCKRKHQSLEHRFELSSKSVIFDSINWKISIDKKNDEKGNVSFHHIYSKTYSKHACKRKQKPNNTYSV